MASDFEPLPALPAFSDDEEEDEGLGVGGEGGGSARGGGAPAVALDVTHMEENDALHFQTAPEAVEAAAEAEAPRARSPAVPAASPPAPPACADAIADAALALDARLDATLRAATAVADRAAAVRAGAASEALHLLALNRPAKLAELDALKARVQATAAHAAAGRREEQ
jgi:hypothetical protein